MSDNSDYQIRPVASNTGQPITDDFSRQWFCRNTDTLQETILTGTRKGVAAYLNKQTPRPQYGWLVSTCVSAAVIDDNGNAVA